MLRTIFLSTLIFVLLAGLIWWWNGPSSDELVVYRAACSNFVQILPLNLALRGNKGFKEYHADRANCVILHYPRKVYKLNRARGEVYYLDYLDAPRRLVDCLIFSRTDWTCSYPDRSGKVVIIDGLKAIHEDEIHADDDPQFAFFSLRRWQWWTVILLWWIGDPRGAWLIPEQHEYIN